MPVKVSWIRARACGPHASSSCAWAPVQRSARLVADEYQPIAATVASPRPSRPRRHPFPRRERAWSSASMRAAMSGQRSEGRGVRPRRIASTIRWGTTTCRGQLGGPSSLALVSASSEPWKGRRPARTSHSVKQNAYWSAAGPARLPVCCSGAMYGGVPTTMLAAVITVTDASRSSPDRELKCSALARSSSWCSVVGLARPKSMTLACPSSVIITLAGLKSRWTRLAWWAAASPRPASRITSTRACQECGFFIHSSRVDPRTSSMATMRPPDSTSTS